MSLECLHVCIDDTSRIAFTDIFPNERALSTISFLQNAGKYYQNLGVKISRVMTDNGPCYTSHAFAAACKQLGLKHVRTKPYTPRTNGKAECFIQTTIREWAYARAYQSSQQRKTILPQWTHMYNWYRPHGGIKDQTLISKLELKRNNLLINHT